MFGARSDMTVRNKNEIVVIGVGGGAGTDAIINRIMSNPGVTVMVVTDTSDIRDFRDTTNIPTPILPPPVIPQLLVAYDKDDKTSNRAKRRKEERDRKKKKRFK